MRVGVLRHFGSFRRYAVNYLRQKALAVRVEGVRKRGLLSGVDSQAVVLLDLNPSNDVVAFEGVERGEPSSGILVTLGLVKIVSDGNQLGPNEVVGELLALRGSPSAGSADPGFFQGNQMVLQIHSN